MRILLVDDHPLFRDGLASLLAAWGQEVVGSASDGAEAVRLADAFAPDLVLMDVRMPGTSGIEATGQIAQRNPQTAIVMLTVSEDEEDLFAAIRAGARGYLLKNVEGHELRTMLAAIERGEAAISPPTAARILSALASRGDGSHGRDPDALTARERDVLQGVTDGLRNKEIAAALAISENTVKYHLRNILEKLHAGSRAEVAARAVREGLTAPRPPAPAVRPGPSDPSFPPDRRP